MSGIWVEVSLRNFRVAVHVSLEIFGALVKSSMQFGTVKNSGSAIRAGFCLAAFWIPVLAAIKFFSRVLRTFIWSKLTFKAVDLRL